MSVRATARSFTDLFTRHRELAWQFTLRAVELRHRGSQLGILWAIFNPLLMLALYVTVFGFIFENRFGVVAGETQLDFALAVFAGLILFHVFSETVSAAPGFIVGNPNLVKKVVFPLEVLPLANVGAVWFHAFVSLSLLFLAALVCGKIHSFSGLLWLPLILTPHILLCAGLALGLAALGVFFRDIAQVMAVVTQVVLYASAVFYAPSKVYSVPKLWVVLKWNPLLETIDLTRRALLWDQGINLSILAYTWAVGLLALFFGAWFFKKTQPGFADVL